MLRITVDTNTLISATISKGNEYELLKLVKIGRVKLILSLQILKEFKEVMSRPKFGYPRSVINNVLKNIFSISEIVFPKEKLNVIKDDPSDNMVLECALSGKVDYLISGDNHLLKIKEYKGIKIVRTLEILNLI
ncbi:putative toxin-antitoxin system toxin component, PIN family [archaeon]|nr:putative toxin-antitoxin system toxin component, PIN family [archaeon]|tara:strand:- start:822 stop:1223 length:402 start_codon:yes stop_codon:yes gene_type:complete